MAHLPITDDACAAIRFSPHSALQFASIALFMILTYPPLNGARGSLNFTAQLRLRPPD